MTVRDLTLYAVWATQSGAVITLQSPFGDELTFNTTVVPSTLMVGDVFTLTATGTALTSGSDWLWYINGTQVNTTSSYTFVTTQIGEQLVDLMVTVNGVTYSASFKITVSSAAVYTLGYDANGGTGTLPDDVSFKEGDTITVVAPAGLSRPGFTHVSWNTDPQGLGTVYGDGSTIIMPSHNVILYAQWSRN